MNPNLQNQPQLNANATPRLRPLALSKADPDMELYTKLQKEGREGTKRFLDYVFWQARQGNFREAFGLFYAIEAVHKMRLDPDFAALNGMYRKHLQPRVDEIGQLVTEARFREAHTKLDELEAESGLWFRQVRVHIRDGQTVWLLNETQQAWALAEQGRREEALRQLDMLQERGYSVARDRRLIEALPPAPPSPALVPPAPTPA